MRLNKFISDSGFCSRREADKLIEQGRVLINGHRSKTGQQVEANDFVEIDGQRIKAKRQKERVYLAFNKPEGITCTTESSVKGNIVDFINYPDKIFPIGRLDKFSNGLIFMTNDGDIVNKILRAGNAHEKEYVVTIDRPVSDDFLRKMSNGIPILDTVTQKCKVTKVSKNTFRIILTQGLNRQIRRMCEYLACRVLSLQRTRIMKVELAKLKLGTWRHLTPSEMEEINKMISESSNTKEASKDANKQGRRSMAKRPVQGKAKAFSKTSKSPQSKRGGQKSSQSSKRKNNSRPQKKRR
ncbi:23S rRNA pseudouridine(2604) synthase RluF [Lentisphaera marina]|uniref:23S rRNA pseudouridine(2604) synthase RluF n=1 Tax=Lentisphaera marina TaxID=1111041 RepID=UPI002366C0AC|nr:23S rRNA pseudouridine(2604) synthase RluF [Lentisphaera marina]MDD7987113.1 23S rRNA pseudouridine(2604) synthase RluF [Lentisphaera marina]